MGLTVEGRKKICPNVPGAEHLARISVERARTMSSAIAATQPRHVPLAAKTTFT